MLTHDQHLLVQHVCEQWAATHGRATLSVLSLLILREHCAWAGDLRSRLSEVSSGTLDADHQSLNRMLRRLEGLGLIRCARTSSHGPGASRKHYETTETGEAALRAHLMHTLAYMRSPVFRRSSAELLAAAAPPCVCGNPPSLNGRVH